MKVKAYLHKNGKQKEIRRFTVVQAYGCKKSLYELLLIKIQKVFELEQWMFNLCYKDDDGDMVAFSSQEELEEALPFLKNDTLYMHVNHDHDLPEW